MKARNWPFVVACVWFAAGPTDAQETVRPLPAAKKAPAHDKSNDINSFLSLNQRDQWVFDGEKDEVIVVHVFSKEFDPILDLAKTEKVDDRALMDEIDDPGLESRFSFRLRDKGQYKIRIHAFKYQGGGNYTLRVQRFKAQTLTVGKPLTGAFDREGKSHFFFQGVNDQILIPDFKEAAASWTMLDYKGREMETWAGSVLVERNGECSLIVTGLAEYRYDLLLRTGRQQNLAQGKELERSLSKGEMDVLNFQGKPGEFRLVEVVRKGDVFARPLYAPLDKKSEPQVLGSSSAGDRRDLTFLPVANRGGRMRFAMILGREGRYQLQLLAATSTSYTLTMADPSVPIETGREVEGNLPVGGAGFYSFKAAPGQLFQASLSSQKFVPVLRLYDDTGEMVDRSTDDSDALEGRLAHMVVKEGLYRLLVSSLGDGGGGDFRLALKEPKLKEFKFGERSQGNIQGGAMDFWAFQGREGQSVFLNVRSNAFDPALSLHSPDGLTLAAEKAGGTQTGSLFALKLPKTGRYTVWISSNRGAGDYTLRLIDGD